MIKRFHEAPISIFDKVQKLTDGDYCLVHLLDESTEYREKFEEAVAKGREVILDNSIFELGTAFDMDRFAKWVIRLKPTYYIIPDVLEDADGTIKNLYKFREKYPNLPGKAMGVVQGSSRNEWTRCYRAVEPLVDKIAISMDYSMLKGLDSGYASKEQVMMDGRMHLLTQAACTSLINAKKPHHLLGVMLPQELSLYSANKKMFGWIDSVDTSNPVVHGLLRYRYFEEGMQFKAPDKLADHIYDEVDDLQWQAIEFNINEFRRMCNG